MAGFGHARKTKVFLAKKFNARIKRLVRLASKEVARG
jgi:hypothetical protein